MPAQLPETCLEAKTLITLADFSQKAFNELQNGEMILSYNFETKKNETTKLIQKNSPIHSRVVKFFFEDREIIGTEDHPFFSPEFGWASINPYRTEQYYKSLNEVRELRLRMGMHFHKGGEKELRGILLYTEKQQMYNISALEKNYTYYANGILTSIE